jgi:hypothetical protein
MPNDCVRIWAVSDPAAKWHPQGRKVLSDTASLGFLYTFQNEDESQYTPTFIEAFADKLAADSCYQVTNDLGRTNALYELYNSISLPKALASDGQMGSMYEMNDNYYLNAIHGGPNVEEFS